MIMSKAHSWRQNRIILKWPAERWLCGRTSKHTGATPAPAIHKIIPKKIRIATRPRTTSAFSVQRK